MFVYTWRVRCLVLGIASACLTVWTIHANWRSEPSWLSMAVVACSGLCTVIAFHLYTLRCSETHSLKTLLLEYSIFQMAALVGPWYVSKLERAWREPREAQERFLRELISRDAKTEYGRRYLAGIRSLRDFRDKHPLTKYDHYRDYFQRLADGEKGVCVGARVDRFGVSSGTTGKGKLVPFLRSTSGDLVRNVFLRRLMKLSPVQRMGMVYCRPNHTLTKSGALVSPLTFVPDTPAMRHMIGAIMNTPFGAFQISTDFEATYVHLLFALTDKNLTIFTAPFASQVYRAFSMLEDERDMFLDDLSRGRVSPRLDLEAGVRRLLDAALGANPARAQELRAEFARGFVGIAGRIWPHLGCIITIDISGLKEKLEAKYTQGTKLYSPSYACTECLSIGLNLWNDGRSPQYVLMPNEVVVEFIPEDSSDLDNPETLLIDEVEVGKRFELVITSISGVYRYRMGDVVEVVGFHDNCPVIEVKYRTGELLNLHSEKIDKLVVDNAVQESLTNWPEATLVDWTCAESPLMLEDQGGGGTYAMFYLLFVELDSVENLRLTEEQKSLFDQSLRRQHEFYDHYRQVGTICEARVMIVRPGSFEKLRDFIVATSTASYNQFKMPKKLRTKATFDLMMGSVVEG